MKLVVILMQLVKCSVMIFVSIRHLPVNSISNNALKKIQMMKEDERKTFHKWLSDICTASTVSEYHIICNNIEKKVEQYKMEGWWHWWKVRRFHIVPALHGFDLPRMNLAEVGHSSMKRHHPMWLSQMVNDDCIHFLIQEANYNKFLNNSDKVRGKGPTQFD